MGIKIGRERKEIEREAERWRGYRERERVMGGTKGGERERERKD